MAHYEATRAFTKRELAAIVVAVAVVVGVLVWDQWRLRRLAYLAEQNCAAVLRIAQGNQP